MSAPYIWDAFISYSHKDAVWVSGWLLPHLEAKGIRVCIDARDFDAGVPIVQEIERVVTNSAKTLVVLSPNYLESEWGAFENVMVQTMDPAARQRRLLPLLVTPCELPLRLKQLIYVDFSNPALAQFSLNRVIAAIKPANNPLERPPMT